MDSIHRLTDGGISRWNILLSAVCSALLMMAGQVFAEDQPAAQPSPAASAASLGAAEGDIAGLHVDIIELKHTSGGTVTLKFAMTNAGPKKFSYHTEMSEPKEGEFGSIDGVHLIDA